RIENSVERETYVKKIAKDYEISEESMYSEVLKKTKPRKITEVHLKNGPEAVVTGRTEKGDEKGNRLLHDERFILSLLCTDNSMFKAIKDLFNTDLFSSDENKQLAEMIKDRLENKKGIVPAELLALAGKESAGNFARILNEECHCDDNVRAFRDKVRSIGLFRIEDRQKQIIGLLRDEANLPKGDVEKLKQEFKDLTLRIKDLKKA
ncbi:MAG: DNA primase, partial [Clostridiales bacterium]|nr:DNA primase [Clostridiales bacterium]